MCDRIPPLNIGSGIFFVQSKLMALYLWFSNKYRSALLNSSFIFYDFFYCYLPQYFQSQASIILTVYVQNKSIFITKLGRFFKITF